VKSLLNPIQIQKGKTISIYPLFPALPFLIPKLELLDLSGGGFRQFPKFHGFGRFKLGHSFFAESDDVLCLGMGSGFGDHERLGDFAPFVVRNGNHRNFQNIRVAINHVFNFNGGDVFAAADNDVFFCGP